jgi:hypothetical protein
MRYEAVALVAGILLGLSYIAYFLYFGADSVDTSLGLFIKGFLMLALFFGLYKASRSK